MAYKWNLDNKQNLHTNMWTTPKIRNK
jgi:hypothetical protein